jgi:hypothetical protein
MGTGRRHRRDRDCDVVRGLIDRDAARLVLTPDGRAVLDALPGAGARSSPGVAYRSFGRISRCAPSSRPPGPTGSTRSSMTGTGCRSAARATTDRSSHSRVATAVQLRALSGELWRSLGHRISRTHKAANGPDGGRPQHVAAGSQPPIPAVDDELSLGARSAVGLKLGGAGVDVEASCTNPHSRSPVVVAGGPPSAPRLTEDAGGRLSMPATLSGSAVFRSVGRPCFRRRSANASSAISWKSCIRSLASWSRACQVASSN